MAALTKLGTTPYIIRYQLDGVAGAAVKTQAQLLSDLAAGALKELLGRITTDAAWSNLNNDPRFVLDAIAFLSVANDLPVMTWSTAGGRNLTCSFGQTGNAYRVNVRFLPTPGA